MNGQTPDMGRDESHMKMLLTAVLLALGACTTYVRDWSDEEDYELCHSLAEYRTNVWAGPDSLRNIRAELTRRGLVRPAYWNAVDRGAVAIGMNVCEIMAAWGEPARRNRSVSTRVVRVQYVFVRPSRYAYTEDGTLTSWQD